MSRSFPPRIWKALRRAHEVKDTESLCGEICKEICREILQGARWGSKAPDSINIYLANWVNIFTSASILMQMAPGMVFYARRSSWTFLSKFKTLQVSWPISQRLGLRAANVGRSHGTYREHPVERVSNEEHMVNMWRLLSSSLVNNVWVRPCKSQSTKGIVKMESPLWLPKRERNSKSLSWKGFWTSDEPSQMPVGCASDGVLASHLIRSI